MDDYFRPLSRLFSKVEINDQKGSGISFGRLVERIARLIVLQEKKGNKVFFIGNGGSAAIASHMACDLLKNAEISALVFNDASLLTCISNDLGYEYVFQKPIERLAQENDILFSISSSGESKNIINAAKAAKKKGCFVVTLSGFNKNNALRQLGDMNFYLPSYSYGYVETIHFAIMHFIVDTVIENKKAGR